MYLRLHDLRVSHLHLLHTLLCQQRVYIFWLHDTLCVGPLTLLDLFLCQIRHVEAFPFIFCPSLIEILDEIRLCMSHHGHINWAAGLPYLGIGCGLRLCRVCL